MIGFYQGSSLPAQENLKMGIYFIVAEGKGKLYRVLADGAAATLVAETNNDQEFAALQAAVEQAQKDIQANATSVAGALASIKKITDAHGETLQNITTEASNIRTLAQGAADQAALNKTAHENNAKAIAANEEAIGKIKDGQTIDSFADVEAALAGKQATGDYALNSKVDGVQDEVDALEELVGSLPTGTTATTVVEYINKKTEGIATDSALGELQSQLNGVQGDVNEIKGDYLKSVDKTELSGLISAEATTARAAEKANADAIKAISDDYLKAADKTELSGQITKNAEDIAAIKEDVDYFFKDAGFDDPETAKVYKDTLKEIQDYIDSDASAAAEMAGSIKANADDIDALEGRMTTAEGDIDAVEGRMTTAEGKIEALEALFDGEEEGSVADMIADAVAAEALLREAGDEAAEASAAAALAAAQGAQAAAEVADGKAVAAQGEVDALEEVVATKAAQADLEALEDRVEANEGDIAGIIEDIEGEGGINAKIAAVDKKADDNKTAIESNDADIAALMAMLTWKQA